jgi:hypothetical protein
LASPTVPLSMVHADDVAAVMVGPADVVVAADVEAVGGVVIDSEEDAGFEELSHAATVTSTATAITRCRVFMHGACLNRHQRSL